MEVRGSFLMMRNCIANCCAGTLGANRYGGTHSCRSTVASGRPESEDARYYQCAQRLYCGEGKACLPISARTGKVTHLHKP